MRTFLICQIFLSSFFLNLIIAARKTVGDLKFLHLMKVGVTILVPVIVQRILVLGIVQRTLNLVSTTNKSFLVQPRQKFIVKSNRENYVGKII